MYLSTAVCCRTGVLVWHQTDTLILVHGDAGPVVIAKTACISTHADPGAVIATIVIPTVTILPVAMDLSDQAKLGAKRKVIRSVWS